MNVPSQFSRLLLPLLFSSLRLAHAIAKAPPAKPWDTLENVTYKPQRWDDGDSFHVVTADGNELILRLYFVDCPEEEKIYADRIRDQAAYFGVSEEAVMALGHKASAFTREALSKPFTVQTRWHKALELNAIWQIGYNAVPLKVRMNIRESLRKPPRLINSHEYSQISTLYALGPSRLTRPLYRSYLACRFRSAIVLKMLSFCTPVHGPTSSIFLQDIAIIF